MLNIKLYESVDWIQFAQERVQCLAFVNTGMGLPEMSLHAKEGRKCLDQLRKYQMLKRILFHTVLDLYTYTRVLEFTAELEVKFSPQNL
jgi:hypothetical protein